MTTAPATVTLETSVSAARTLLQQRQIHHLPVLDQGRLVGIVSERDLLQVQPSPATSLSVWEINYLLDKLSVGEVMTRFVITVTPDTPVLEAVRRLVGQKISALPVVENGQLIGIITRSDVLRLFLTSQEELSVAA
jgi:acetoin utilization protein AcuB